jgi:Lantibiotic dehydratase, N terminus
MTEPGARWRTVPNALVRHAGYPVADLAGLADERLAAAARDLLEAWRAARAVAAETKQALREHGNGAAGNGALASAVGMLAPLPESCPVPDQIVDGYRAAVDELDRLARGVEVAHREAMANGRRHVIDLFTDPWRQQVVLLSNRAAFGQLRAWLADPGRGGAHARKLTDLLAMYLQRIATKNETNAHFGPFGIACFDEDLPGVRWLVRDAVERLTFLPHWAASELLRAWVADCEGIRPRPHPMAFWSQDGPVRFEFIDAPGLPYPWWLTGPHCPKLDARQRWLFDLIDGDRSVRELRALWAKQHGADGFDEALATIAADGLIIAEPELPGGDADTVSRLRAELVNLNSDPEPADLISKSLGEFTTAEPERRISLLEGHTRAFEKITSRSASRNSGEHYADRGVVFEECLSRAYEFRFGREIERFITADLAEVYDGLLLGSRLRIARERTILADWLSHAFGRRRVVPLREVYQQFVADRTWFARRCDEVDTEVAAAEHDFGAALLESWDGHAPELVLPVGTVRRRMAGFPTEPAALCNPDVMLGAPHPDAFDDGAFFGVVGDCHAVRELLTHGPFAPILRDRIPEIAAEVVDGYRRIVADDEVLVDVVREHSSKVCAQLDLPVWHLELVDRSPKPRDKVLLPRDLMLEIDANADVVLRSTRVPGRLRLMTSISGADSIRHDPLAVFGFPHNLGGGLLGSVHAPRLPRIRSGRVILARRRWQVPAGDLDAWQPPRRFDSRDARLFVSATLLREHLDLPRHVFAKFAHEPKPVYLDWNAPLLVRQFFRLAGAASPDDIVEISEMLPGPDQLWFRLDQHGYTSELRCTVFSR